MCPGLRTEFPIYPFSYTFHQAGKWFCIPNLFYPPIEHLFHLAGKKDLQFYHYSSDQYVPIRELVPASSFLFPPGETSSFYLALIPFYLTIYP